jgi:hypothetical protein
MKGKYDIFEHVIRLVAHEAAAKGEVFGYVRWAMRTFQDTWQQSALEILEKELRKLNKAPELAEVEIIRFKLSQQLIECEAICAAHGLTDLTHYTIIARDPRNQMVVLVSTERAADLSAE